MSRLLVWVLTLGLLAISSLARADVEISKIGAYAVETGSWTAHLMRRDAPMQCPIGTSRDCYYVYLDVRNASDRTLDCSVQIRWENGAAAPSSQTVAATVAKSSAYPVVVLNGGAKVNANLQYSVRCSARSAGSTTPPPSTTPPSSGSGDIAMEGSPEYVISGDRTQMTVQNTPVVNRRAAGTSGTLSLDVWFMTQKGGSQGYRVAQINVGTLQARMQIVVNRTVTIDPPDGTFYVVYALMENGQLLDRVDFVNQVVVGAGSPPVTQPPQTRAGVWFDGQQPRYALSVDQRQLTIQSTEIINNRTTVSGLLTIEVIFVSEIGGYSGFRVGSVTVGTMQAASRLTVSQTIPISIPTSVARGTYFVRYVLLEGNAARDSYDIPTPVTVGGSGTQPPSLPSVTLDVSPAFITVGGTAVLSWSSSNATSCTAAGQWSGARATSGSVTVAPGTPGNFTYSLTCTGPGGSFTASKVLPVDPAPPQRVCVKFKKGKCKKWKTM